MASFAGTQITSRYAIVCFFPAVVAGCLYVRAARRGSGWAVVLSFLVGFASSGALSYCLFWQAMRFID
jgi:hypothetical protein